MPKVPSQQMFSSKSRRSEESLSRRSQEISNLPSFVQTSNKMFDDEIVSNRNQSDRQFIEPESAQNLGTLRKFLLQRPRLSYDMKYYWHSDILPIRHFTDEPISSNQKARKPKQPNLSSERPLGKRLTKPNRATFLKARALSLAVCTVGKMSRLLILPLITW